MPLTQVLLHGEAVGTTTEYEDNYLWRGWFSIAHLNGEIMTFIKEHLSTQPTPVGLLITQADGIDPVPDDENRRRRTVYHPNTYETYSAKLSDPLIMVALCARDVFHPRLVLTPLDDESFAKGVYETLAERIHPVPWEQREARLFWRGKASGEFHDNIRTRTVQALLSNPLANVKLTWYEDHIQTEGLTDPANTLAYQHGQRPFQDYLHYKYTLIIDGACIASSLQWTLASGCVPVLITHPGNDWWFKRYLCPMKHYVPVAYDLSDLEERLAWLVSHDEEARTIAENAVEFSKYYLSAGFQKYHLSNEIDRIVNAV
jgi:hypothetical protein